MSKYRREVLAATLILIAVGVFAAASEKKSPPPRTLNGLPLLFSDNFESENTGRWQPTDPKAWRISRQGDNHVYNQFNRRSDFKPPVRSPYNRSLIENLTLSDFVLDVQLQSTIPDYGHRDLCLFFGYQDDAHLYYVHLGQKMDDHANNIFIVNDKPRLKISIKTTPGTNWDDNWHHARVVRNVKTGSIEVFFDDMKTPVMTATDKTFTWGRVGIGSFDDTGNFDDVLVYGKKAEPRK